jgi:hypothetical protein
MTNSLTVIDKDLLISATNEVLENTDYAQKDIAAKSNINAGQFSSFLRRKSPHGNLSDEKAQNLLVALGEVAPNVVQGNGLPVDLSGRKISVTEKPDNSLLDDIRLSDVNALVKTLQTFGVRTADIKTLLNNQAHAEVVANLVKHLARTLGE